MPRKKVDFEVVRRIGLELPDVTDGSSDRGTALKLNGKLLACKATNRSAERNSLMLRTSPIERDRLLADAPDIYYLPDHYLKFPCVLVRLDRVTRRELRSALRNAWRHAMEQVVIGG